MQRIGIVRLIGGIVGWAGQIITSSMILAVLIFIVVNFYIFSSIVNLDSFFYAFLLLSLLTDGLFTLIHLPRRRRSVRHAQFSPAKLTVVIACHNGEDVIKETIENAAVHVPLKQIIVVDDASTDNTAAVARATGAKVIVNAVNLNKVRSIDAGVAKAKTPYVLILDDDTLIGKSFIPTSLLDDGYTAVAFNVMPITEKTLLNELQRLEYHSTMQIGKHLRASAGAIGNVSGAIGLFRTDDLKRQFALHSGQFAGEDEQRTLLAHMYGQGKGITYYDSLVLTKAPATYKELFRQRAYSWSLSVPEQMVLYWRVLLAPRFHYLLKAEKAYLIYIYLTEPLRILFFWTLIKQPSHMVVTYGFYLLLNVIIWLRLGRKDTLRAVICSPIYTMWLITCRFIGYFYWLKVKANYLMRRLHKQANQRKLLLEYAFTFAIIVSSWTISIQHFRSEMHLFYKIRTDSLTSNADAFDYSSVTTQEQLAALASPGNPSSVAVFVEQGDTLRAVAHKTVDNYALGQPAVLVRVTDYQRWKIDMWLASRLPANVVNQPGTMIGVAKSLVKQAIAAGTPARKHP
jgi:cellulose synthase/poly-beta-1,6-N-acetylglucosamine synthase-like glycosyltransferase